MSARSMMAMRVMRCPPAWIAFASARVASPRRSRHDGGSIGLAQRRMLPCAERLFYYPHFPALIAPHAANLVSGANAEIEVRHQLDEDLSSARSLLAAAPEAGRRP